MKKHKKIFKILFIVMVIVLMTGCEEIKDLDFNERCVMCGADTYFPAYLVKLIANIIAFIQLMAPVIIIILGMIELFKAVIASDEKKMSESKNSLIRKIIAGIMIYLVIAVIQFAFTVVPNFGDGDVDVMECISYFISGPDGISGCPERITGEGVPLKDKDDPYDFNIVDPIEKEKKDYVEDEYNNRKYKNEDPDYGWCNRESLNNDEETCIKRGCTYCEEEGICAVNGECKADYRCYKCGTGSNVTYEWSKTKHSGCTAMSKVDHNGQKMDYGACNALSASNNARCYECNDGSYVWTTNAGTGCYVTNKASTSESCKKLNK